MRLFFPAGSTGMCSTFEDEDKMKGSNNLVQVGLWRRLLGDLRLLFSLIKDYWKGAYRDVSIRSVLVFVVAVVYIICPVDFISDFIPGLGQLDDAAVLFLCLYLLEKDLFKYKAWKEKDGPPV